MSTLNIAGEQYICSICSGFFYVVCFVGRTFTFALDPGNGWTRNDVSLDTVCLVWS